ncbi:NAD-dependent epimerase/dehydratase family protein [Nocardia transvalensis]|uniref:NAD-dependent epimerase/dehydratase family protein n=1 Tax=Nocardia transvalensis TaxID=37333 RepID=UPI001895D43F|nr:NAD-dependent epimerase/dehydratase family protein [Nocardia transvalensis]MBF6329818.1 NAD-dependent epimerase/dehydratase family protein [Nocardia transvalensis]
MPTAVVTGGSGFVGSHLVEALVRQGYDVIVYDPAPLPPDLRCDREKVRSVRADIRDADAVASVVTPEVDTVFHLSAMVGVDYYLQDPLDVIDVVVTGTKNVLRSALDAGAKVVLASTSEVYGRNPDPPWSEDDDRVLGSTAADRWSYSTSKAVAEHVTFGYTHHRGLRALIVRYFNVYGPRQRPAYVLSKTIHRLLHEQPPLLYDGGAQTRCFTFVDDAVDATVRLAACTAAQGQSFNVGSQRETTVAEAIALATRIAGVDVEPVVFETRAALGATYEDIPRRVPDTAKVRGLLGWECATTLQEGLTKTIEWAKTSSWWLDGTPV